MKPLVLLVALLLSASLCNAQDIRSKVQTQAPSEQRTDLIDAETGVIYGIPYGTSEDELIGKFGKPTGYVLLFAGNTAMIYGRFHAFIFAEGKLIGIRITDSLLDWKLSQDVANQPGGMLSERMAGNCGPFDSPRWRLNNGIVKGTDLTEVKKILGHELLGDEYNRYYETKTSRIELDFARYTDEGNNERAFKVQGILVKKR